MTVSITAGIPVFAGPLDVVTSIQAPNIPGGGAIGIGDITGLQAVLDTKLEDVIGTIAPFTTAVTITGAELNYLAGVTSLIQTQLDGKVDLAGDTMTGNLLFGAGIQLEADAGTAGLPSVVCVGDLDTGIFWPAADTLGISVGGLDSFVILPTGLLRSQNAVYETLVVADDDIPNKKYVDDAIVAVVGGPFLELAGGVMAGAIDMDGSILILDADGDTSISAVVDDILNIDVAGSSAFTMDGTNISVVGQGIKNVLDPVAAQDAATMNYVDTEITALNLGTTYLPLAGGAMSGPISMAGSGITNLLDPTGAQDAATQNYVDTEIAALGVGAGTGPFLELAGGLMAGAIDMGTNVINNVVNPTNPQDAATRDFVDTADALNLPLAGGTMSGAIAMGANFITGVVDPVNPQDASTMNYVDTEIIALGLGGATGPFLELAGGTMAGAIAMGDNLITGVTDPVAAQDAATMNYVDTEIIALGLGGATGPFLELAGGTMAGAIDMGANQINDVADPTIAQDAATMNYVDTEIAALSSGVFVVASGDTMTGDLVMSAGSQHSADSGSIGAPSYAFTGSLDDGMWHDGTSIRFAVEGASALTISPAGGANEVDVHGRQVVGLADPTADDHAVTKGFVDAQLHVRLLGSVTGVDLLSTGVTPVYTIPAGKMHIVTQVIVRATSYTPGGAPTNPVGSVGLSGNYDQIVVDTTLDWGGTAGAGDQVVYLPPKDGADSPNAGSIVRFEVDTAGGGTFSALDATVYVLGIEL